MFGFLARQDRFHHPIFIILPPLQIATSNSHPPATMPPSAKNKRPKAKNPKFCICGKKFWTPATFGQHVIHCASYIQQTSTRLLHHHAPPRDVVAKEAWGQQRYNPSSLKQQRLQLMTSCREADEVNARYKLHQREYNLQLLRNIHFRN